MRKFQQNRNTTKNNDSQKAVKLKLTKQTTTKPQQKEVFSYNEAPQSSSDIVLIDKIEENKLFRSDGKLTDELVIEVPDNENWIQAQLLKKTRLEGAEKEKKEKGVTIETSTLDSYGLQIQKKTVKATQKQSSSEKEEDAPVEDIKTQVLRELATGFTVEEKLKIEVSEANATIGDKEKKKLLGDLENLEEGTTEESYARVPVESFGAALLRGMGWNEEADKE
ncbi:hypothetical protein BB558_006338, partial [Smittium angustum]